MFTVPLRVSVEVTVAVRVNDSPGATLALDVVSAIDVATGAPPPLPPVVTEPPPPPQPSAEITRNNAAANTAGLYFLMRIRKSIATAQATLKDQQTSRDLS